MIDIAIALPVVGVVLASLITFFATRSSALIQHKGKPENAQYDQLQEDLAAEREARIQSETARREFERKMQRRMDRFEARDRVYIPHILRLNHHIESGVGPPAPPIPKVILDFLEAEQEE